MLCRPQLELGRLKTPGSPGMVEVMLGEAKSLCLKTLRAKSMTELLAPNCWFSLGLWSEAS